LNLSGNKYELAWADFTTLPLRSARCDLRKVFRTEAPFSLQIRAFLRRLSAKIGAASAFSASFWQKRGGLRAKCEVGVIAMSNLLSENQSLWQRLLETLTLEHIFSPDELAEMTPLEKRLLKVYLREGSIGLLEVTSTKFAKEHRKHRQEVLSIIRSLRFNAWTEKIDAFLKVAVFETLHRVYMEALSHLTEKLLKGDLMRKSEIAVVQLLRDILEDYDEQLRGLQQHEEIRQIMASWEDTR